MPAPRVTVRPLTDEDREAIARWRYPGALGIYDPGAGAAELRAPEHVALVGADGALVGYGTLGAEARVPGGEYAEDDGVVDLGMGVRPDLVGTGHGGPGLRALMADAEEGRAVRRFRVTVAAVNARATALVVGQGFEETHRFVRERDGREFVQYERGTLARIAHSAGTNVH